MTTKKTTSFSGVTASADCSAKQSHFAVISGDRTVTFAGTAGVVCIGTFSNKPKSGEAAEIDDGPIVKIKLSATLAANAKVSTTNAGLAKAVATGENILGYLLEGGIANDIVAMYWEPGAIAP